MIKQPSQLSIYFLSSFFCFFFVFYLKKINQSIYENTSKKLEGFYLIFDKRQSTHWRDGLDTKITLQIFQFIVHRDSNVRWFDKLINKNNSNLNNYSSITK